MSCARSSYIEMSFCSAKLTTGTPTRRDADSNETLSAGSPVYPIHHTAPDECAHKSFAWVSLNHRIGCRFECVRLLIVGCLGRQYGTELRESCRLGFGVG